MQIEIHPVTPDHWGGMQELFGPRGACAGCWCMYWRLKRSICSQQLGEGNRLAMQALIESGEVPGLLAYARDTESDTALTPAGWVSVAPRSAFTRLKYSRILKPIDDQPVWAIVCFFVARRYRNQGLTTQLLQAAVEYARENGAHIVEGYPVEPEKKHIDPASGYKGFASAFLKAGFSEVARRSPTRPIMRYVIDHA